MTTIISLKLKNFKSFKKADVPFANGFTAIAGANASGKSNILDSLLFAMGITSLKMLRASRLSELVNHDSKEGYAKVELLLKTKENKELLITRIIDKQGKSIYKMDGKRKTLNEIQSLLLEMGINPQGHNIVVQGNITKVIEMNAKQRRQMIEEVAGLQEFEEKKDEAMKKLEKVEQRVKDTNLVLNEREKYLEQLEKEKESAQKHNELQKEMKMSKATILSEEIKIIKKELAGAHKKLESMDKEINAGRSERDKLQEEEKELERKVEEITKQLIDSGEKTYSTVGKEVEQKKGKLSIINERLNSKKYAKEQRSKTAYRFEEENKELEKSKKEKEEQLKELENAFEKIKESLSKINSAINAKSPKLAEKKKGIADDESKLHELRKELEELREKWHAVVSAKNNIEKDIKNANSALGDLEHRKKIIEEKTAKQKEIEKKFNEIEAKNPKEKAQQKEKEIEKLLGEIHSARGKIENLKEANEKLSGVKASCPTCDSSIDEKKKKTILESREAEIRALDSKITKLKGSREKLETERAEFIKLEHELHETKSSLRNFQGIGEELEEIKEKIAEYKETAGSKEAIKLSAEEKEIASKIEAAEKEKLKLESKLKEFRESETNVEMNELLEKMNELNEHKSEKEKLIASISTEIKQAIEKKIKSNAQEAEEAQKDAEEAETRIKEFEKEKIEEEKKLAELEAELEKANKANKLLEEEKNRLTTKIKNISEKRDELSRKIENTERDMNDYNLQQSKNEVRIVDLEEEFKYYEGIKTLQEFKLNDLKNRIPEIEKELEKMGPINMKALQDFDSYKKEVEDVRIKADKLETEMKAVLEMIDKIEVKKLNVFMDCFNHVRKKFSELYYNFFEGEGQLDLSDKESPLDGGLQIHAKYKEDTLKSIDAMSGGEKSLTALAFLFAIQSFEPAPFYILDEVDAALDKDNSIKVGRLIKEHSKYSQFISISHNDSVINQADQIIGVALNKEKSSVIGLKLKKETHE